MLIGLAMLQVYLTRSSWMVRLDYDGDLYLVLGVSPFASEEG